MKPNNRLKVVDLFQPVADQALTCPTYTSTISAGFPSPADDYIEKNLDLNDMMVSHPAATFYVRVEGDSMKDAGIQSGDLLVVDRAVEAADGKIVVAILNGEFTVKRIRIRNSHVRLIPENPLYSPIDIDQESDFQVWGVVTYVIHKT
jgi:DNA polymerase V